MAGRVYRSERSKQGMDPPGYGLRGVTRTPAPELRRRYPRIPAERACFVP
jgi:hypothetical protein